MGRSGNITQNGKVLAGGTAIIGLWMIIAPWVFSYQEVTSALWNSVIVGVVVLAVSVVRMSSNRLASVAWLNVAAAFWMLASPFVLGYSQGAESVVGDVNPAVGNHIVPGIFLLVLSWLSAVMNNPRTAG